MPPNGSHYHEGKCFLLAELRSLIKTNCDLSQIVRIRGRQMRGLAESTRPLVVSSGCAFPCVAAEATLLRASSEQCRPVWALAPGASRL